MFAVAASVGSPLRTARGEPVYLVDLDQQSNAIESMPDWPDALVAAHPVSLSGEFYSGISAGNYYYRLASAAAGPGYLKASAHGEIFFPDTAAASLEIPSALSQHSDADATFLLDDLIITGPGDYVEATLNLHFSGGLGANAYARSLDPTDFQTRAEALSRVTIVGQVRIQGDVSAAFQGTQERKSEWSAQQGGSSHFEDFGILEDWGGGDISIPSLVLPVRAPFELYLSMNALQSTQVSGGFGSYPHELLSEAAASFGSTLSFSKSGPVFGLPEGYTANSVQGRIANNSYVPEPATFAIVFMGSLSMLFFGRGALPPGRHHHH